MHGNRHSGECLPAIEYADGGRTWYADGACVNAPKSVVPVIVAAEETAEATTSFSGMAHMACAAPVPVAHHVLHGDGSMTLFACTDVFGWLLSGRAFATAVLTRVSLTDDVVAFTGFTHAYAASKETTVTIVNKAVTCIRQRY